MLNAFLYHTWTELKLYFRVPMSLFWIVLFPLLQLVLFGALFGGYSPIQVDIGIVNQDGAPRSREFVDHFKAIDVIHLHFDSLENLLEKVKQNRITALLVLPKDFGERLSKKEAVISLYYSPTQGPINEVLFSIMNEVVRRMQEKLFGQTGPITIEKRTVTLSSGKIDYTAHLLPGLIGMVLLSVSVFSVAIPVVTAREKGYLKRLCVSPIPRWTYVFSFLAAGAVICYIQASILLVSGVGIYGIHSVGSFLDLFILLSLGICSFLAIGVLLASVSPTSVTANILGFAVFFPMLFLSEIYFPITNLPSWLKEIVSFFPLINFLRVFRKIMNEGDCLWQFYREIAVLSGWAIVPTALACFLFRWTPKK